MIDPAYTGRYVAIDYSDYLNKDSLNKDSEPTDKSTNVAFKKIDIKKLLPLLKQTALLEVAVSNDSDYQNLPLTQADKQKGYELLFLKNSSYSTKSIIGDVFDTDDLAYGSSSRLEKTLSELPHPKTADSESGGCDCSSDEYANGKQR
ncbi:hypothetical protein ACGTJS_12145 [Faucicola mancuniensis]|uniref:hypothetical protein n=1 Tax=Faucicola mancuniensis TaxID=1309795 RepID=UPI003977ABAE